MNLKRNFKPFLFLLCVIALGCWALFPMHDFQAHLAPGDNGRDFYCYQKTYQGALPYQDYWWVYGPLMPYVYSFFFHLFGVSIKSILGASLLLNLVSGVLVFLILRQFIFPFLALVGALWFWTFNPPFSYTYNHIGGIACLLGTLYLGLCYLRESRARYIYAGLLLTFLLSLIKINIGLSTLFSFILSVWIIDKSRPCPQEKRRSRILIAGVFISLLFLVMIYGLLLHKLPLYAVRQCLPYIPSDRPIHTPFLKTLLLLLHSYVNNFFSSVPDFIFGTIIFLCAGKIVSDLRLKKGDPGSRKENLLLFMILILFWVFTLHEYLLSGVAYRTYWIVGIQIVFMFLILGLGIRDLPSRLKNILSFSLLLAVLFNSLSIRLFIQKFKVPQQYLGYPNAQIYVTNSQDCLRTIRSTVDYIKARLKEDEPILALPYEPLYYYLTGKDSPTRQLIFFDHIHIAPPQEQEVIDSLEDNNVSWILLSNRSHSPVPGLGTFGETYGVQLAQYIINNYELVQTFGDWEKPGGTSDNHAIRIYRKK